MKHLFSVFAAASALSLVPVLSAPALASPPHRVVGTVTGKHVGTVVRRFGNRNFTLRFNSKGKLVRATESGGAGHGMKSKVAMLAIPKAQKRAGHGFNADGCWFYICDDYGNCIWVYDPDPNDC